jgi:uncharacterized membrane protein
MGEGRGSRMRRRDWIVWFVAAVAIGAVFGQAVESTVVAVVVLALIVAAAVTRAVVGWARRRRGPR